jgi:quercetin dioxygenase-like cupin family protein/2-polyprenyl-3-methyl-5-hydroxy-6-metoxy-1,4-benzoquinol methylase
MPGDVKVCGACAYTELVPVLDMGLQPVPEGARARKRYPLKLVRCINCGLVQLSYIVPQDELFPPDHPYSTGNSAALREHYSKLTNNLRYPRGAVVVDIGANDGTLLCSYPDDGLKLIAVEPTDQGRKISQGITWVKDFFTRDIAGSILQEYGPAAVITACNVLAHVPDPHDFLNGVYELLDDNGVFVTENHDYASVSDGLQIDTVYHEHLRYYTPGTLAFLLERHGLRVEKVVPVPTHGGSFRTYARKVKPDFPARAHRVATALRGMLYDLAVSKRKKVYGISAATRAVPLIHYAGIAEFISCVCEVPGSDKIGQKMPGTQIPVVDESVLIADQPPYALLLAWHMTDVIVPKLRKLGYKGRFIVPLPEPKVLDDLSLLLALLVQPAERSPVSVSPLSGQGLLMTDRFEDDRGVIQDLLGPVDSITEIFTKAGAVRGNHTHNETTQLTYIVSGALMVVTRAPGGEPFTEEYGRGSLICEEPGIAHAWKALEDTIVLVFTRGPRSGANYESDTQRLALEDRLL